MRFDTIEMDINDYADAMIVVTDNGKAIDNIKVTEKLNEYEEIRKRKNKEIKKFRKREELYQRVIGGLMAFLELNVNNELWWDWNE